MTERIVRSCVQFRRPFRLAGIDELLPPGTYEIETVEEPIDSLSIIGWRRISTAITVQGPTTLSRQVASIDPEDLAAALRKDRINGDDQI